MKHRSVRYGIAAELYGVSKATLYRKVKCGEVRVRRPSRRITLLSVDDLERVFGWNDGAPIPFVDEYEPLPDRASFRAILRKVEAS